MNRVNPYEYERILRAWCVLLQSYQGSNAEKNEIRYGWASRHVFLVCFSSVITYLLKF